MQDPTEGIGTKMTYADTERFYLTLVNTLRARGVTCAITSGMACVSYGIVPTTADCDVLCVPDGAAQVLQTLGEVALGEARAQYRGTVGAPMEPRWLSGGWTCHFYWNGPTEQAYLDIFGIPPRGSTAWAEEIQGVYASPHTVAEMKRTQRDRDWPVATSLGARLLERGDLRGWLDIFDADLLTSLIARVPCPAEVVARRPLLQLALARDSRLKQAVRVEQEFWHELDRQRLAIYQKAVRPYASAVRQASLPGDAPLSAQHSLRLRCARELLPVNPLREYGLSNLLRETREELLKLFSPALLEWLPDVRANFKALENDTDD